MSVNPSTTDSLLLEQIIEYAGNDCSSEDGSSSLNANKSPRHNYMSQDESYSGNMPANDDNDDYDIDEQSYVESGTQRKTDGDTEPRTLYDDNDEDDDNNEDDDNDEDDENASKEGNVNEGGVDGPNGNDEHVDDLEFDLDIGYDEYQQETLDRHWEVMAKTFRSEGEAYMFYNQYAKDGGFSIRRDLKRFAKDSKNFCA
ncbi:putative LRR receptor-like serine/threonine-protein kinase [Hordeum vulgare]|nr:putative LRR receptor-like serine/threonine-protein kinase [Hordeum vulgare]